MKFRKKPVIIEAVQLLWNTWPEMSEHAGVGYLVEGKPEGAFLDENGIPSPFPVTVTFPDGTEGLMMGLLIPTLEGLMVAKEGDWVIKGIKGEIYPCKPDIFEATYEPVDKNFNTYKE
jgi:hypothetical protein